MDKSNKSPRNPQIKARFAHWPDGLFVLSYDPAELPDDHVLLTEMLSEQQHFIADLIEYATNRSTRTLMPVNLARLNPN